MAPIPLILMAGAAGAAAKRGRRAWVESKMEPMWDELADRLAVDRPRPGSRVVFAWFEGLRVQLQWSDHVGIVVVYRVAYNGVGEFVSMRAAYNSPRLAFWREREDPEFDGMFSYRSQGGFTETLTPARKRALLALRREFPTFEMQTHQVHVSHAGAPDSTDDVIATARSLAELVRAFLDAAEIE